VFDTPSTGSAPAPLGAAEVARGLPAVEILTAHFSLGSDGVAPFAAGEENRLALDAVLRIAGRGAAELPVLTTNAGIDASRSANDERYEVEAPVADDGRRVSPLVLHGPSGVGKTHLCELLVAARRAARPYDAIVRRTAAEFADGYAAAVDADDMEPFRRTVREADLFVIEDVGKLGQKAAAQWELLHTLDALERRGSTVVATLDATPARFDALLPGLVGRLTGG
jgi:DNA replication protein DnaC